MPAPTPARAADRNLLFGILALQMDFVSREQLIAGMHAWVLAKARPLGEILCEQRALGAERAKKNRASVRKPGGQADLRVPSIPSVAWLL